jgi:hypothetical protein
MTTRSVSARPSGLIALVTEERALRVLPIELRQARGTVTRRSGLTGSLPCALAEQLPKHIHGRFPLTAPDPPVGQDEPSQHRPAAPVIRTTIVAARQFPSRAVVSVRRPPAWTWPAQVRSISPASMALIGLATERSQAVSRSARHPHLLPRLPRPAPRIVACGAGEDENGPREGGPFTRQTSNVMRFRDCRSVACTVHHS